MPDLDEKAKLQLIAREWISVQSTILAYTSSMIRDVHDREDIVQQTAFYLIEHADDYEEGTEFVRWAMKVARYRILEYWNRKSSEKKHYLILSSEALAMSFEEHFKGDDQRREQLEHCVDQISPRHKNVLALRYVDDASVGEIAEKMGVSTNAISIVLHRLRTALERCIRSRLETAHE